MWIGFLAALACVSAAPDKAAISVGEARARLAGQLADRVQVCIGVGDGSGAASALGALAAVADDRALTTEAAFAVLDLCGQTGLARDIRARLVSSEEGVYEKARAELTDALKKLAAARCDLPDKDAAKVLGPNDGCPATSARAFAQTPGGAVLVLSDTLSRLDGTRWQVMGPDAIRVHQPVSAMFVDSKGRTWLGSTAPRRSSPGLVGHLERYSAGPVGYFEPGKGGLIAGRWHVFGGADEITSFAENKRGLWVASRTRLLLYDGDRLVPFDCPLPYSPFRKLLAHPRSGDLWVVDIDRISRLGDSGWRSWKLGDRAPVGGCMTNDGPVILLRSGLLFARPGGQSLEMRFDSEMADVASDGRDALWCMAADGRVLRGTAAGGWQAFDAPAGLRVSPRPTIFLDRTGRLWLSRGRGIEVCAGGPGAAKPVPVATGNTVVLAAAPLVSVAGSGGWMLEPQRIEMKDDEEAGEGAPGAGDLGGFAEDGGKGEATPKSLLEELRRSPLSSDIFQKLFRLLERSPDPGVRNEAMTLVIGQLKMGTVNWAFLARPDLVGEFVDGEQPMDACARLVYAEQLPDSRRARAAIQPALFEAMTRAGFGEFAHPAFLDEDPWMPPHEELAGAGLYEAAFVACKLQALRKHYHGLEHWQHMIRYCVAAGDAAAARRYAALAEQWFTGPRRAELEALIPADAADKTRIESAVLAPYRWIRRLKVKADGGLGPVSAGTSQVCILDEGANALVPVAVADGSIRAQFAQPPGPVRAVLSADGGVSLIARLDDGSLALCYGASDSPPLGQPPAPVKIVGLTDAFDSFSATAVLDGVLYCFDGGLTKVDVKAGKVAWRNEAIIGGANSWRSLLERSLPAPDGADVFVAASRMLHCVDAATGATRWTADCGAEGTPAPADDVVAVAAGRYEVRGLNRKTGAPLWKHLTQHGVDTGLVTDGERAFYAARSGRVAALDVKTGEFLWARPTDIALDPPASPREGPTALLVHGGRLAACNRFGYIEFDAKTGSVLRRLPVSTARPMLSTPQGVVVMTAPDRLVCIAPPASAELGERVLRLAEENREKNPKTALGMARLVAAYIDPSNLRAHELVLELAVKAENPVQWQNCYSLMLASVDPFTPEARALMRKHLGRAWHQGDRGRAEFGLVARAHIERGAVHEAAKTFAALGQVRNSVELMGLMLRLWLAAGLDEQAKQAVEMLKPFGSGPDVAVRVLASEGREEEAIELAAAFAGDKNRLPLLYAAVGLSGGVGLFERAKDMLDRSAAFLPRRDRGLALAWLLSSAGVADNVLEREGARLADEIARYRTLLHERREALQALDRQDELKAVESQLELLDKAGFP